jgi:hypothetical protein
MRDNFFARVNSGDILPHLPIEIVHPRVDITSRTWIAWDLKKPWDTTCVALVREDEENLTAWTPGHLVEWVWRGPLNIPQHGAVVLSSWLSPVKNLELQKDIPHIEVNTTIIKLWDPDPERECGLLLSRLGEYGYELSMIMGALKRGGATIERDEGTKLAKWLTNN